ncbi:MAG: hypothetical protein RLZZ577_1773 [Bacteroidota bacterium]
MKKLIFTIGVTILLSTTSCHKNQEARKPISHSSGSFMKESVNRNKKLIAGEEERILVFLYNYE